MNRRDLLLNEMKITQWELTKPQVLKGDAQIRLPEQVKLVVICDEDQQKSLLFQDVLRCLKLTPKDYQWFDAEQAQRLTFSHSPFFWLIQPEKQAQAFAKRWAKQTAWQTASWQTLQASETKRQLWQQLADFCVDNEE